MESQQHDLDLPVFDLGTIFSATDKFSSGNKIGEGGFGPVYKVIIPLHHCLLKTHIVVFSPF